MAFYVKKENTQTRSFVTAIDAINFGIGLGGNFKVIDELDTVIYSSYALAEEKDNRSFLQDQA